MVEQAGERRRGAEERRTPEERGGATEPRGPSGEGRAPEERILREQQLSTERQREGRGWSELPPGAARGTTPVEKRDVTRESVQHVAGGAPGAFRAETEGERVPVRRHEEEKERGKEKQR